MGRPIKKKFFGNLNNEQFGNVGVNSGIGGEGVASVSISNTGTRYSTGDIVTFTAPQEPTGRTATGHATFTTNGTGAFGITAVVIDDAGTGYTSAPSVSVTGATTVNTVGTSTNASYTLTNMTSVAGIYLGMKADAPYGMQSNNYVTAVGTNSVTLFKTMTATTASLAVAFSSAGASFAGSVTLTSTTTNALKVMAYLLAKDGGTGAKLADIVKQEASHRYLVKTSEGIGQCKLVNTSTLAVGEMNIVATDTNGSTYYVTKLTARRAVITRSTASGSFVYASNSSVGWNISTPATGIVTIANV
jgi:hypothetical protein